jgi:hypothetical protein
MSGEAYELGTAKTIEDGLETVMDRRSDTFNSFKVEELQTQWKHKISVIPEAEGITQKWWTYTGGVSRNGPEAEIPAGETITSDQSGEYIVGTPALGGGAGRVTGTAQDGAGDDWWTGYTDRINVPDADDNGAGVGYKYFAQGEGDAGGATEAGAQEYVWFRSGVAGASDRVVPRDQWNGEDLSEFEADLSEPFHRGGFFRLDHTFYNHGNVDVNFGIKTADGGLEIVTLHAFNVPGAPMWSQSDLKWQMGTEGANVTGYLNAAHYKAGNGRRNIRPDGTGRDGAVFGSGVNLSQGDPQPLISIRLRDGFENVNLSPVGLAVNMNAGYYVFVSVAAELENANFTRPNDELPAVTTPSSEYVAVADNDATGYAELGEIEFLEYVPDGGFFSTASVDVSIDEFALAPDEIASLGVIPVDATALNGSSFRWAGNA